MGSYSDAIGTIDSLEELGDINKRYNIDRDFDIFDNENEFDDVEAGV